MVERLPSHRSQQLKSRQPRTYAGASAAEAYQLQRTAMQTRSDDRARAHARTRKDSIPGATLELFIPTRPPGTAAAKI